MKISAEFASAGVLLALTAFKQHVASTDALALRPVSAKAAKGTQGT